MNRRCFAALCLLSASICAAQSTNPRKPAFDLSKIGFVLDGHQICEDTGRLQDYPSKVMDEITAGGVQSVPVLIGMLTDDHVIKTEEPIICFWGQMTTGDLAFCLLADLFVAPGEKTTLPGADWNEMLGPPGDLPAWQQLHHFIQEHGRSGLQAKWQNLWDKYRGQVVWDARQKCFKMKKQ